MTNVRSFHLTADEAIDVVGEFFTLLRQDEAAKSPCDRAMVRHRGEQYLERLELATRRAESV